MDSLFLPITDKDLKRQYPELGNQPEFLGITSAELKFVWGYSNRSSPFVLDENLDDVARVKAVYEYAFSKLPDENRKKEYYSFNFPDKIKTAMDKMQTYHPTIRARSKNIIQKILENYEKMVDVDLDDFVETMVDAETGQILKKINWTGRNNYVTSAAKISDTLPQLIKQVEEGFGIIEDNADGVAGAKKAIQRFHSDNKDK